MSLTGIADIDNVYDVSKHVHVNTAILERRVFYGNGIVDKSFFIFCYQSHNL